MTKAADIIKGEVTPSISRMSEFSKIVESWMKDFSFPSTSDILSQYKKVLPLPYDIKKDKETGNIIFEMALSGYSKGEISVEQTDTGIKITAGTDGATNAKYSYIYQGLTHKSFSAFFPIVQLFDVKRAELKDGILTIEVAIFNKKEEVKKIPVT